MSKQNIPKLPAEAIKFAKSMGLDLNGLEPEAEDIWKMLDEMSTRDPLQYEAFVSQQFENAKETDDKKDKNDEKRSFRPTAAFSVSTTSLSGDGLKIRDAGTSSGKKVFINICSSTVIEEPTDKSGKPVKGDRAVADGLNIPLIVGPVRAADITSAEKDKELYVDVVVHQRVIELSREKYFKAQIVDLALDWVIQETKVDCDRKWAHVTESSYKGGRGENKETPVLFFVDASGAPVSATPYSETAAASAATTTATAPSPVLSSTSSLLSQINKEKQGQSQEAAAKVDIFAATNTSKTTKKDIIQEKELPHKAKVTLIQEIGAPSPKSPFSDEPPLKAAPAPAAKSAPKASVTESGKKTSFNAGFLNAPSKPTAAVNISNILNPPLPTAPVVLPASSSGRTTAPVSSVSSVAPSVVASASASAPAVAPELKVEAEVAPEVTKAPTKMEYLGMEKLLSNFDEEFSNTAAVANDSTFLDTESANSMISDLAKVLSGGSSLLNGTTPPSTTGNNQKTVRANSSNSTAAKRCIVDDLVFANNAPTVVTVTAKAEQEAGAGAERSGGVLALSIAGLSTTLDTSTMELLVSRDEIIVRVDQQHLAGTEPTLSNNEPATFGTKYAGGGYRLQEGTASASFKKKKGMLVVKVHYNLAE